MKKKERKGKRGKGTKDQAHIQGGFDMMKKRIWLVGKWFTDVQPAGL